MSDRIKVVYIAGSGRSGSTLLGNLLGQIEGWADVGELHHIWDRELIENQVCGCGQQIHDCGFWNPVIHDLAEKSGAADPSRMLRLRQTLFRSRHLLLPAFLRFGGRNREALAEYLSGVGQLYRSIREVSGATVIVDSSKIPMQAYCLSLIDDIEPHILHLVRDPRAVAYSWSVRKKKRENALGGSQTLEMKLLKTTLIWTVWNYLIGKKTRPTAGSYQLVRYEDFVRDPQETIRRIRDRLGEHDAALPGIVEGSVELAPTHTISGNPGRFKTGPVAIHEDDEWRRRLPVWTRILVSCLSLKGLVDYGYGFFGGNGRNLR